MRLRPPAPEPPQCSRRRPAHAARTAFRSCSTATPTCLYRASIIQIRPYTVFRLPVPVSAIFCSGFFAPGRDWSTLLPVPGPSGHPTFSGRFSVTRLSRNRAGRNGGRCRVPERLRVGGDTVIGLSILKLGGLHT